MRTSYGFVLILYAISIFFIEVRNASPCSNICWVAYYNPTSNYTAGSETRIKINPGKTITGIITVDAEHLANPSAWEYLRFMKDEDSQALVVQIYAGGPGVLGKIRLFPEDNTGPLYNGMFSQEQVFTEQNINIQISDEDILKNRAYQLYLGTPGEALSLKYGYQYPVYWDRFSDSRLNDTTVIKSDTKATVVKAVTICEHAQPQLCDVGETEVVAANLGESYNLSCSGSGAPYLEVTWYRGSDSNITEERIKTYDNSNADNFVSSTLMITSFSASHIGTWTCKITNKNFGLSVEKTYIMTTVKTPENTTYNFSATKDVSFKWVVQGWLEQVRVQNKSYIHLDCSGTHSDSTEINYSTNSTSFEQEARLVIKKGKKLNKLVCTLYYVDHTLYYVDLTCHSMFGDPLGTRVAVLILSLFSTGGKDRQPLAVAGKRYELDKIEITRISGNGSVVIAIFIVPCCCLFFTLCITLLGVCLLKYC